MSYIQAVPTWFALRPPGPLPLPLVKPIEDAAALLDEDLERMMFLPFLAMAFQVTLGWSNPKNGFPQISLNMWNDERKLNIIERERIAF